MVRGLLKAALVARFDLTHTEWSIIAPFLNGIFFVLRTGTPRRDLPERYGPCTTDGL